MLINFITNINNAVLEDREARQRINLMTNVYRELYTRFAIVRRFLIVYERIRSCYCLFISIFKLTSCANQSDQKNNDVIYIGFLPSDLLLREKLSNEDEITKSATKIETSYSSMILSSQTRIDYQWLIEMKHSVRTRNIDLVGINSIQELLKKLKIIRAKVELQ
jgi:hypothetical protein